MHMTSSKNRLSTLFFRTAALGVFTAAASSAGLGAIEIARALGAKVVATTRSEKKRSLLLEAGANEVALVGAQ